MFTEVGPAAAPRPDAEMPRESSSGAALGGGGEMEEFVDLANDFDGHAALFGIRVTTMRGSGLSVRTPLLYALSRRGVLRRVCRSPDGIGARGRCRARSRGARRLSGVLRHLSNDRF